MPLIFKKDLEFNTTVAVWHITEDMAFFWEALDLDNTETSMMAAMKSRRQKEWLTSRYLAHLLCPSECRIKLVKDECGKPTLEDNRHQISISHSRDHVAVLRSDVPGGIDIQHREEKIRRIGHKFISINEMSRLDEHHLLDSYHYFWGAKECMYKAYGKRELDFKKHMHIYPFKVYHDNLELSGWVRKNDVSQDYHIYAEKIQEYYLCFALLDKK